MPKNHPFVYLKNDVNAKDKFKKQRAIVKRPVQSTDEEDEHEPMPRHFHQRRLYASIRLFDRERSIRNRNRSLKVNAIIDVVRLHFFVRIDPKLQKKFLDSYGLNLLTLEDFNKTGLFSIVDETMFSKFKQDLAAFYSASSDETYQGKPWAIIVLIRDFLFLSSNRRRLSYSDSIIHLNLLPLTDRRSRDLLTQLEEYLNSQQKRFLVNRYQTNIEVQNLSRIEVREIVENFDNVKAITSSRAANIGPGAYGTVIRSYGFTVAADPNNVPVGIIDTGVELIAPLRALNSGIALDITPMGAPSIDDNGHGTMVAGLVALGSDFLENMRSEYASHATIATFKVLQNGTEDLQVNKIIDGIRVMYERGVRVFNMSLNEAFHKKYNSGVSDFAFQLDKIAFELDLLVFISAGNLSEAHVEALQQEVHPSHAYPKHFYCIGDESDIHKCELTNICAPAESWNNVSVGAIAENYQPSFTVGVTPAKEFPAVYTRKFHYDYDQKINGTSFLRAQKNKFLNKPDIVFNGGDFIDYDAGLEVLTSPNFSGNKYFSKSAGTSLATPLVTSLAAQISKLYPKLNMQTVKAILLNAAEMPCGQDPQIFRPFKKLLQRLAGSGLPKKEYLFFNNEDEITYIIEDAIALEEIKTIPIKLPPEILESAKKLCFTATLCYKFDPLQDDHLNYCPVQIVFGFFKNVAVDQLADENAEIYKIPKGPTWSEDFWPIENRLYSNVQYHFFYLDAGKLAATEHTIALGIKCTGKREIDPQHRRSIESNPHSFSLVLRISEEPEARERGTLHNRMIALNSIEAIPTIDLDAYLDQG
ncbi:MAG: S8 family peptidase [Chitinophagaceae bacterium]